MRRPSAPRASTAVAVVAALVAVLTVMFPGLGFGQPTSVQGGSPSAVYMQKNPDICSEVIPDGVTVMEQEITLDEPSHVLAYFSFEWNELDREVGEIGFALDETGGGFFGGLFGPPPFDATSGTVMWSFENVDAGQHTVTVQSFVIPIPGRAELPPSHVSAFLNHCALSVFVTPVVQ